MKTLIIIVLFCALNSCGTRKPSFIESGDKVVKVMGIDSTESAYLINIRNKEMGDYILVSWKNEEDRCRNNIEIGKKYSLNIDIETIAVGYFDGYVVDGKEFDKETTIAYTDNLRGLCLDNN